eukprot:CAMPEP_0182854040 /NCGR_PEP_ID=MMETSP0034_2-20130328/1020_1 /TAXON_ID=156128 /ORGANISM="Nephroselmis pyriformis, Strain CCMP717" /LENGTH=3798 /DNA_ID=CAMNT_0024984833 /DNA_START=206 /DNA_END=11599 /DNA_ORIENTATION=+
MGGLRGQKAMLQALAVLLLFAQQTWAWMTVDGGQNITLHGSVNVGPVGTQENYDLSVFGDVNVGVSQDVDLDAIAPSLVVEGAITTAKLVFRDSGLIDDGSPNFNLKRKLLQNAIGGKIDFVYLSSGLELTPSGIAENQTLSFTRQQGSVTTGDRVETKVFQVKVGVADTGLGPNDGHVEILAAGTSAQFIVESVKGPGNKSQLTLAESNPPQLIAAGEPVLASKFSFTNEEGNMNMQGGAYSIMTLVDRRPDAPPVGGDAGYWQRIYDDYKANPRMVVNATVDGEILVNITAPDSRGAFPGTSFVEKKVKAVLTLSQGRSQFSLSNEPLRSQDQISWRNNTHEVMNFKFEEIALITEYMDGRVRLGQQVPPPVGAANPNIPRFQGANFQVGKLNVNYFGGDFAKYTADYNNQPGTTIHVFEINTDGDIPDAQFNPATDFAYPLYLKSRNHVKVESANMFISEGPLRSGGLRLNETGVGQHGNDVGIDIYSPQTTAGGYGGGVRIKGAKKLTVGGITFLDTNDGRLFTATAANAHTPRRMTSAGTLRISVFDPLIADGVLPTYGSAPTSTTSWKQTEVYFDGNEAAGRARVRIGNAIIHDGYSEATAATGLVANEPVTLIGVSSDVGPRTNALGQVIDDGLPVAEDVYNPAVNLHPGMIVIRSHKEVRMDTGAYLRVGVPQNGVITNGTEQSIHGDDEFESLYLKNNLGVEAGMWLDGQQSLYMDKWGGEDYLYRGRPTFLARDIGIEGCALPHPTPGAFDAETRFKYAARLDCVSRIGVLPTPANTEKAASTLGKYLNDGQHKEEYKELYITSANYVDIDSRARLKIGGMFFDGLGAQELDPNNAFTETYDNTGVFDPLKGDKPNTIRGDKGLHINAGMKSGNLTLTGGLSRSASQGGSVLVKSGGSGIAETWEGNSGDIDVRTADGGVIGNSGNVTQGTGDATEGVTGHFNITTGWSKKASLAADGGGWTGGIHMRTGNATEGEAGDITGYVGITGVGDGGMVDFHAGRTDGVAGIGGFVVIDSGNSSAAAGGSGGSMVFTAGAGACYNTGASEVLCEDPSELNPTPGDGGDFVVTAGYSQENTGGEIIMTTGKTDAGLAGNKDPTYGYKRSGDMTLMTADVDNANTGEITIRTGHTTGQDTGIAGNIYMGNGHSRLDGANVTIEAGAAVDTRSTPPRTPEGGEVFIKGGTAWWAGTAGIGGNVTMVGGNGHSFGGNAHVLGGNTKEFGNVVTGGHVYIESGTGGTKHSGSIHLFTPSSGSLGGAGGVEVFTGDSFNKASVDGVGGAEKGNGGNMTVRLGTNHGLPAALDRTGWRGAHFRVDAGNTSFASGIGGPVILNAGHGNAGVGGEVNITGGEGHGFPTYNLLTDRFDNMGYGGNVTIRGGEAQYDWGGSIALVSGKPGTLYQSRSGNISLITHDAYNGAPAGNTANGPEQGVSGNIDIRTGFGGTSSGNITVFTGNGTRAASGSIHMFAGFSELGPGGIVNITGGRGTNPLTGTLGGVERDVRLDDGDVNIRSGHTVKIIGDYSSELLAGHAYDREWTETKLNADLTSTTITYASINGNQQGGFVDITAGNSQHQLGGDVSVTGGVGLSNDGGDVFITSGVGNSTAPNIALSDGFGGLGGDMTQKNTATSGQIHIKTADAFPSMWRELSDISLGGFAAPFHWPDNGYESTGISGKLSVSTGESGNGNSGNVDIWTGHATKGVGGNITLRVGNGTDEYGYGERSGIDGGSILMEAGSGAAHGHAGGHVNLTGGMGISSTVSSTRGGDVLLHGGNSVVAYEKSYTSNKQWFPFNRVPQSALRTKVATCRGITSTTCDEEDGGTVDIIGGDSDRGDGGDLFMHAGTGHNKAGGWVTIAAGTAHGCGDCYSDCGTTGTTTPTVFDELGRPVDKRCDDGGTVNITAGWARTSYGGDVLMTTGYSLATSSGSLIVKTSNSGAAGVSGGMFFDTGSTTKGPSGEFKVVTGAALQGAGGNITLRVGRGTKGEALYGHNGGGVTIESGHTDDGYGAVGGPIAITAGNGYNTSTTDGGDGGSISITAGDAYGANSAIDMGGHIGIRAGNASSSYGGNITIVSGKSTATSSGSVRVATPNAGTAGVSGDVFVDTGSTTAGVSGDFQVRTGDAVQGAGGNITLRVGSATQGAAATGTNGGDVLMAAGESKDTYATGGSVYVFAGNGTNTDATNGGDGGNIYMTAGSSFGGNTATDVGGHVGISGGNATSSYGGNITLVTGYSSSTSSGHMRIATPDSGTAGVSGGVWVDTGSTTAGNSGTVNVLTGDATQGAGGNITLQVGKTTQGTAAKGTNGGDITMNAGETTDTYATGGSVYIRGGNGTSVDATNGGDGGNIFGTAGTAFGMNTVTDLGGAIAWRAGNASAAYGGNVTLVSGYSTQTSSGSINIATPDAGTTGVSGGIFTFTGASTEGHSGEYYVGTGGATGGPGGNISFVVGTGTKSTTSAGSNGGDVMMRAGTTADAHATGGSVYMFAGNGTSTDGTDGGDGGNIYMTAGKAHGHNVETDVGGHIGFNAGNATTSYGGNITLVSGFSESTSSGSIRMYTPDAGDHGVSGTITMDTGDTSGGTSGAFIVTTGNGVEGAGGNISLTVGSGEAGRGGHGQNGGGVIIGAGETKDDEAKGGIVIIYAGDGTSDDHSDGGDGGDVHVTAGSGWGRNQETDMGGAMVLRGGNATASYGGNITLISGKSNTTSSGSLNVHTADAGFYGVSGGMHFTTGDTTDGDSGDFTVNTGHALQGAGGDITLTVGDADRDQDLGTYNGGNVVVTAGLTKDSFATGGYVSITAGEATDHSGTGGDIVVTAGEGSNTDWDDGGDGGSVHITGGEAKGQNKVLDTGGDVMITGGEAYASTGGNIAVKSGFSESTSSGWVSVVTANAGFYGVSGAIDLITGNTTDGEAGAITLQTGEGQGGSGGNINLFVGTGDYGDGGDITAVAGTSTDWGGAGGRISILAGTGNTGPGGAVLIGSGTGNATDSGSVSIYSADSGFYGVSGDISLTTGTSTAGDSGAIFLSTGNTTTGHGGDMSIMVGSGAVGNGGAIYAAAGRTTDDNMAGGAIALSAGDGAAIYGGRGGPVLLHGGVAEGTEDCALESWDCNGIVISSQVYYSVIYGCEEKVCGRTGESSYLCNGVAVDEASYDAVFGGCTQRCLGGPVELFGGKSLAGSGGSVHLRGGEGVGEGVGLGGNVLLTGGFSQGGPGGAVLITSGSGNSSEPSGPVVIRSENSGGEGVSGALEMNTGSSCNGDSGDITLTSGSSFYGHGGDILLSVGTGNTGKGGNVELTAGRTMDNYGAGGDVLVTAGIADFDVGGDVVMASGKSTSTSSGTVTIKTDDAGFYGVSGFMLMRTGTATAGTSGRIDVLTGNATEGSGGDINVAVGTGNTGNGGDVYMTSGETTATGHAGGKIYITGGLGSNSDETDGGDGGAIEITGGASLGGNKATDVGGDIVVTAGYAASSTGGNVAVTSGFSQSTSSGYMKIDTADAGFYGVSGDFTMSTGRATDGDSGKWRVDTGEAHNGHGGNMEMFIGTGDAGNGGDFEVVAGETTDVNSIGGNVMITAGMGSNTAEEGGGSGGAMILTSGAGYGGNIDTDVGGDMKLTAGMSMNSYGGNVVVNGGETFYGHTGGSVVVMTGYSGVEDSGDMMLGTADAGKKGISGSITQATGTSTHGNSGNYSLYTGEAFYGHGGDIVLAVGTGHKADGGDVSITAGETTDFYGVGGNVVITAGLGSNTDADDGGDGGHVIVTAGASKGSNKNLDVGGDVMVTAGSAEASYGGNVAVTSGASTATSSGW